MPFGLVEDWKSNENSQIQTNSFEELRLDTITMRIPNGISKETRSGDGEGGMVLTR